MTELRAMTRSGSLAVRWQWFHYYFLLAVFNLFVIVVSLMAYHHMLNSYDLAWTRLSKLHGRQRWVAILRLAAMGVNAPGNDVFATGRPEQERRRFETAHKELQDLLRDAKLLEVDTAEFEREFEQMIHHERAIFDLMEASDVAEGENAAGSGEALASMAAMDRHLAAAMTTLTELDQHFLMRVDGLLTEYGVQLVARGVFNKSMFALTILMILGMAMSASSPSALT